MNISKALNNFVKKAKIEVLNVTSSYIWAFTPDRMGLVFVPQISDKEFSFSTKLLNTGGDTLLKVNAKSISTKVGKVSKRVPRLPVEAMGGNIELPPSVDFQPYPIEDIYAKLVINNCNPDSILKMETSISYIVDSNTLYMCGIKNATVAFCKEDTTHPPIRFSIAKEHAALSLSANKYRLTDKFGFFLYDGFYFICGKLQQSTLQGSQLETISDVNTDKTLPKKVISLLTKYSRLESNLTVKPFSVNNSRSKTKLEEDYGTFILESYIFDSLSAKRSYEIFLSSNTILFNSENYYLYTSAI